MPDIIALREKEVISRGTDLGVMVNRVAKNMANNYDVIDNNIDRKNFNLRGTAEAVSFKSGETISKLGRKY